MNTISLSPNRKQATALQAIGGYINTAITVIQGLMLAPLYLKFIGGHMYGLWLASGSILGMLGLVNYGVNALFIQRISNAYGQQKLSEAGNYFINGLYIYLCISFLYALIASIVWIWLPDILRLSDDDAKLIQRCFAVALVAMTISILNECFRSFAQALLLPLIPTIIVALGRIAGVIVIIWMLFDNMGLWSIPIGTLITECFIFILSLLYALNLLKKLSPKIHFDKSIMKDYLHTSPALFAARAGTIFSQESDPLIITLCIGPEITTAYILTRRAADIVFSLLSVITGSTVGSFSHLVGNGDIDRICKIAAQILTLSFCIGAIGFATYVGANQFFVTLWVGKNMLIDSNSILFIGIGFLAYTMRSLVSRLLYGLTDFNYTSLAILFEGLARIALAVTLINLFGVIGVPIAFMFCCLTTSLILSWRLKSKLNIFIKKTDGLRLGLAAMSILFFNTSLTYFNLEANSWASFIIATLLLLIANSILIALFYRAQCLEIIKSKFS